MMGRLGLRRVRSRVKRSARVRNALYAPYGSEKPTIDPAMAAELRRDFAAEVVSTGCCPGWPHVGGTPGRAVLALCQVQQSTRPAG